MKKRQVLSAASGVVVSGLIMLAIIPVILTNFGLSRFGFISLSIVLLSATSLLDAGLGRAITYKISKDIFLSKKIDYIGSALLVVSLMSILIALLVYALIYGYISFSNINDVLISELNFSAIILCLTVPLVLIHSILRGVCEGYGEFQISSNSKILATLYFSFFILFSYLIEPTIYFAAFCLFVSRLLSLLHIYIAVAKFANLVVPRRRDEIVFDNDLFNFAGWSSISSIFSTISSIMDRFFGGALLPSAVFGYYSLIADIIMRFLFVPGAISSVLFPKLSASNGRDIRNLFLAYVYLILIILPLSLFFIVGFEFFLALFSFEFDYAEYSYIIYFVSIGFIFTCFSQMPFAYLQSSGYVRLTAIYQVVEFSLFLVIYYFSVLHMALFGLLVAWLSRAIFNFIFLFVCQCIVLTKNEE